MKTIIPLLALSLSFLACNPDDEMVNTPTNSCLSPGIAVKEGTAYDMVPSNDGGFVTAGISNDELILVAVNECVELVWSTTIPAAGSKESVEILATSSGNYLVIGAFESTPYDQLSIWEFDPDGNLVQSQVISTSYPEISVGYATINNDGEVLLAGSLEPETAAPWVPSKPYLIKLNPNFSIAFEKYLDFGNVEHVLGCCFEELPTGNSVLLGYGAQSFGEPSALFFTTMSPSGDSLDHQILLLDVYPNASLVSSDIIQTNNDNLMIYGYFIDDDQLSPLFGIFLMQVSTSGEKIGESAFVAGAGLDLAANHRTGNLTELPTGNLIMTGTESFFLEYNAFICKADDTGQLLWTKVFALPEKQGSHLLVPTDDGFVVSGTLNDENEINHVYFLKTDTEGNTD